MPRRSREVAATPRSWVAGVKRVLGVAETRAPNETRRQRVEPMPARLTIEPARLIPGGWLLRLRLTNGDTPATFEASASQLTDWPERTDWSSWILGWRHHEKASAVHLEPGEFELLRFAVVETESSDPSVTFPTPVPMSPFVDRARQGIATDRPTRISVTIRDCERGSIAME